MKGRAPYATNFNVPAGTINFGGEICVEEAQSNGEDEDGFDENTGLNDRDLAEIVFTILIQHDMILLGLIMKDFTEMVQNMTILDVTLMDMMLMEMLVCVTAL
ncbi:MAG: hypothetical protein IPH36_04110 [Saprospiraceae bacterium]|nr:hypothetical protein [Saprospiraceae bacterium]